MKKLIIAMCLALSACVTIPTKPSEELNKPDPIVVLNCPDLDVLGQEYETREMNMGDLVLIIVEISSQYYLCQASALELLPKPPKEK